MLLFVHHYALPGKTKNSRLTLEAVPVGMMIAYADWMQFFLVDAQGGLQWWLLGVCSKLRVNASLWRDRVKVLPFWIEPLSNLVAPGIIAAVFFFAPSHINLADRADRLH
jgi:hypothetical protein